MDGPLDMTMLRAGAVSLAQQAGELILEVYATEFEVTAKADTSPVTAADVASQRHIVAGLAQLTPGVPVIGEEEDAPPAEARRDWRLFWLVDPLDGTKEFVKRNGEFSVNIALVQDGSPILGVVHAPVTGVTYAGLPRSRHQASAAAWRYDEAGNAHPIHTMAPTEQGVRVMVSRSHSNPKTAAFIAALEQKFGSVETIARGSAIKSCLVADGTAHYYPRLGPTMWWDTAAAQAVLNAAGGEMITQAGGPLRYGGDDLGNPGFVAVYSRDAYLPATGE